MLFFIYNYIQFILRMIVLEIRHKSLKQLICFPSSDKILGYLLLYIFVIYFFSKYFVSLHVHPKSTDKFKMKEMLN